VAEGGSEGSDGWVEEHRRGPPAGARGGARGRPGIKVEAVDVRPKWVAWTAGIGVQR
jgi:hypothetical protein